MQLQRPKRILIVGLDGVPLEIIQRWAAAGYLPTLRRLMETGTVGQLRSTIPPTSGPSWSSFVTGMNPGKTGIYDFLYRRDGTYQFPPVNTSLRGGTSIWRYLSDAGYKVGVLNLPMAYPVEQVNGFMVSGWLTPYTATDYTYPAGLAAELEREVGDYRIYPSETFSEGRKESFLRATNELLDMLTRAAVYLAESKPWDVYMAVFFDTDRVLHQMWHYLDPGHSWWQVGDSGVRPKGTKSGGSTGEILRVAEDDKAGEAEAVVRDYFHRVDESLAHLLEAARADSETLVIVLSDHGMGRANKFIVLNNWLLDIGMLRLKRDPWTRLKEIMFRNGFTLRNIHQIADRLGLAQQAEYVAGYFVDHLLKMAFLSFLDVEWSRSKAYSFGRHLGSIYVNVKGREPQGIVEPGAEYEAVRDEIERLAREFRDPRTGRPLIGEVIRREEVYSGPYLDRAPDLILRPKDPSDIFFGLADFGHRNTVDTVYRYSGMHRDEGMLIMNGPGIRTGGTLADAIIYDVAPTVLHAMGLPVPAEMDGHILAEAFVAGYMELFPATDLPPAVVGTGSKSVAGSGGVRSADAGGPQAVLDYTEEGEKEVLERLQGLGYLG